MCVEARSRRKHVQGVAIPIESTFVLVLADSVLVSAELVLVLAVSELFQSAPLNFYAHLSMLELRSVVKTMQIRGENHANGTREMRRINLWELGRREYSSVFF